VTFQQYFNSLSIYWMIYVYLYWKEKRIRGWNRQTTSAIVNVKLWTYYLADRGKFLSFICMFAVTKFLVLYICSYANFVGDDCISNNRQWQASVDFQIRSNHRSVEILWTKPITLEFVICQQEVLICLLAGGLS